MAEVVTKGTGRVERTADRAQVDVTFEALGADRGEAVSSLNQKVSSVEPLLSRPGVEVRSRQLSVHDNWDGTTRAGSRASQQYTVRVTDVTQLDALLSELVQSEPSWMNGPSWELTDDAEAVHEAQAAAVADALRRAEGYAAALGRRLGPLQRITDGDSERFVPMARAANFEGAGAGGMVDQLNLEAQQITVTVACTGTWSLFD